MTRFYLNLFPHTSANLIKNLFVKVIGPLMGLAEVCYGLLGLIRGKIYWVPLLISLVLAVGLFWRPLRTKAVDFFSIAYHVLLMIGKKWSRFFTSVAAGVIERSSKVTQIRRSVRAMLLFTLVCSSGALWGIWLLDGIAQQDIQGQLFLLIKTFNVLAFAVVIAIVACALDFFSQEGARGTAGHFRLKTIDFSQVAGLDRGEQIGAIMHLSDLHLPGTSERLTEEHAWEASFTGALALAMKQKQNEIDGLVFVVSGDITDTGEPAAWQAARSVFRDFHPSVVIAPGNHDLNIVGYGAASLSCVGDKSDWSGRWVRMHEYMEAACDLMGNRAKVWCDANGLVPLPAKWAAVKDSGMSNNHRFRAAEGLFPLMVSVPSVKSADFVVWNTVRSSSLAFNNSFGEVGDRQLERFSAIRKHRPDNQKPFVHVMHHKLALPEQKLIKNTDKRGAGRMWESIRTAVQLAGMVMHDANKVVATLRGGCDTVVVHGHHHAAFWGEINDDQDGGILQIVSAPSTSLGVEFFTASPEVSNVNCHGAHGRSFEILTIETTARGLRLAAPPSRCQF